VAHRIAVTVGVDVGDPWERHPDPVVADRLHRAWTKGAPVSSDPPREDNHG
jgi:hypothetical protein